jgi:hypothetical protein
MVIDLDVPRVTGTPRGRRWPARRAARPVAVAAVLLTVLSLGGSATPPAGYDTGGRDATAEHLACVGPTGPVTVWTMPD